MADTAVTGAAEAVEVPTSAAPASLAAQLAWQQAEMAEAVAAPFPYANVHGPDWMLAASTAFARQASDLLHNDVLQKEDHTHYREFLTAARAMRLAYLMDVEDELTLVWQAQLGQVDFMEGFTSGIDSCLDALTKLQAPECTYRRTSRMSPRDANEKVRECIVRAYAANHDYPNALKHAGTYIEECGSLDKAKRRKKVQEFMHLMCPPEPPGDV